MELNPHKLRLARLFDRTRLNMALLEMQKRLWRRHIRCLAYHDVPLSQAALFEDQLRFFRRHYVPVGPDDIDALLEDRWPHDRPGLLISFDDGVRSAFEVVAPLLERHGWVGWFFVPVAFADVPISQQAGWSNDRLIWPTELQSDGRVAMSWDEMRQLARRHVVGCHTMNHTRLRESLTDDQLEVEIVQAKELLEERLGCEAPAFCWVGGEEWSYSANAAEAIRRAGFRYSFMTNSGAVRSGTDPLQLQRTHVEAVFPFSLTRFQLSGFLDLKYFAKRRRVNRMTAAQRSGAAAASS